VLDTESCVADGARDMPAVAGSIAVPQLGHGGLVLVSSSPRGIIVPQEGHNQTAMPLVDVQMPFPAGQVALATLACVGTALVDARSPGSMRLPHWGQVSDAQGTPAGWAIVVPQTGQTQVWTALAPIPPPAAPAPTSLGGPLVWTPGH